MTLKQNLNPDKFAKLAVEMTNQQLAIKFGVSTRTVRRYKARLRDHELQSEPECAFPEGSTEIYNKFPCVIANSAIVLSDAEIPDHDPAMFQLALDIGRARGIDTLILNGDMLACDNFSPFPQTNVVRITFRESLAMATQTIRAWRQQFSRIVWLSGNHELRLARKNTGEITLWDFLNNTEGLEFSEYSYCHLISGGTKILVCHPKNYRKNKLSLPTEIAAGKLMCIIAGHTHHLAMGWDKSGKYWVVDGGFCRDTAKTHYKSYQVTTHPEWNPGFVLVEDGYPFLVTPESAQRWLKIVP